MQIKEFIKSICVKQLDRVYEKQLAAKRVDYHDWVCEKESKEPVFDVPQGEDFVVLCQKKGTLRKGALTLLSSAFDFVQQAQVLYGDEDFLDKDGRRKDPWYKPAWSPDTYLSQFYLGSVIAIRKSVWDRGIQGKLQWVEKEKQAEVITDEKNGCTITSIAFEKCEEIKDILLSILEGVGGFEKNCHTVCRYGEILFHVCDKAVWQDYLATSTERQENIKDNSLVSVIIPSKDNPKVLKKCMDSLKDLENIEILVVDNGSSPETRSKIETLLGDHRYLYRPMEFNFSEMCNLGAREAKGQFYLFLNDDIEACGSNWLQKMKEKASQDYVGAVGLKLYYPQSEKIQHAGITNLPVGPVHKLQFAEDNKSYYFERNRGNRNCLAVTGACLLIEADKFKEAGGFKTNLQVAYNDVELGFALYEAGYQNVVILDEFAYHHESLSRGDDITKEKKERLLRERKNLYEMHPAWKGTDPYYPEELSMDGLDSRIVPAYYSAGNVVQEARLQPSVFELQELREDKCLMVNVEQSVPGRLRGYGVVLGDDNACYDRYLLLSKSMQDLSEAVMLKTEMQYRQDLEENMADQRNVALCGFDVEISKEEWERLNTYYIGVIAVHKVSKLKLLNFSGWQLRGKE